MLPFKRILVPVDFFADSVEAIRVAAELCQSFDGKLELIHVHDPQPYALPDGFSMVDEVLLQKVTSGLQEQLDLARRQALEAGAAAVEALLLYGRVATEIAVHAAKGRFDLIVMGTQGRTGIKHLILGSVAERVVRLAPCPVLTVKAAPVQTKEKEQNGSRAGTAVI
jgi:universal stress protein A